MLYSDIHKFTSKFTYFNNCNKCIPVKKRQNFLLGKRSVFHNFKNKLVDYYGCDKCCKLRNLFHEYICPFTTVYKYPEFDEVHEIMRDDVLKDKYTLELP